MAPIIRRTPASIRGPVQGVGGSLGRFLYAPLGPVLLRDDPVSVADGAARPAGHRPPAPRGAAGHRSLLGRAGSQAAALAVRRASCRRVARSRSPPRACSCRSTRTRRPSGGSSTRTRDATWTSAARRAWRSCGSTSGPSSVELARALDSSYAMLLETGSRRGFGDVLRPAAYHNPAQQRLIEAGHASLWVASHEGRELAHTLVHHSGDRAVLFEAGEADLDDAGHRAGCARGSPVRGQLPAPVDHHPLGGRDGLRDL